MRTKFPDNGRSGREKGRGKLKDWSPQGFQKTNPTQNEKNTYKIS